jgi:hypothetical protein
MLFRDWLRGEGFLRHSPKDGNVCLLYHEAGANLKRVTGKISMIAIFHRPLLSLFPLVSHHQPIEFIIGSCISIIVACPIITIRRRKKKKKN